MAIALFDVDRDGRRDIVVDNDFAVPDYAWLRSTPVKRPAAVAERAAGEVQSGPWGDRLAAHGV